MRGREREHSAAPRATLGRMHRSPPSPEARQKWGDDYDDSGEWTEVRQRRRKERRTADGGHDRSRQRSRYRSRSTFNPSNRFFNDRQFWNQPSTRDPAQRDMAQPRFSRERG
ncbi:hypothetical protein A2U01_0032998, partial [Trifolium medium]|nr:hypothetical protein [Trifolium medium]